MIPKGPCAQIVYTLCPMYLYREYCKVKVYTMLGGCQNDGPFLGALNIRCRTRIRTPKGTLMLTTGPLCGYMDAEGMLMMMTMWTLAFLRLD